MTTGKMNDSTRALHRWCELAGVNESTARKLLALRNGREHGYTKKPLAKSTEVALDSTWPDLTQVERDSLTYRFGSPAPRRAPRPKEEDAKKEVPEEQPRKRNGSIETDDQLIELWLSALPPNTKHAYGADVNGLMDHLGGDVTLQEITADDLTDFYADLAGYNTRERTINSIRALFSFGESVGYLRDLYADEEEEEEEVDDDLDRLSTPVLDNDSDLDHLSTPAGANATPEQLTAIRNMLAYLGRAPTEKYIQALTKVQASSEMDMLIAKIDQRKRDAAQAARAMQQKQKRGL